MFPDVLGFKTAAIAGLVSLAVGFAGGAYSGYRWQAGIVANLKLADERAENASLAKIAAIGKQLAAANSKNGAHDVVAQTKLVNHYITLTKEVPYYVTVTQDNASGCISYGFVRVLVAGQRGVAASALALPAGVTDDSCTGYTLSTLASALSPGFLAANQNAQQLNDLIHSINENDTIAPH